MSDAPNLHPYKRRVIIEELERRLLLSADLPTPLFPVDLVDPWLADPAAQIEALASEDFGHAAAAESSSGREIVFVDPGVDDYEELVHDLRASSLAGRQIEVVQLDGERDGIAQISEALAGRGELAAVHVISHGTDAAVQLGSGWLDAESLYTHAGAIAGWGDSLADRGDLLFCRSRAPTWPPAPMPRERRHSAATGSSSTRRGRSRRASPSVPKRSRSGKGFSRSSA
jgi:hypothetical protein